MNKPLNLTPAYSFTAEEIAMLSAAWVTLSEKLSKRGPETEMEAAVYMHGKAAIGLSAKLNRLIEAL